MKLQTILGEFDVRFRYFTNATIARRYNGPPQRGVRCAVRAPTSHDRYPTYKEWEAVCDSRQQFIKATGRKLAFAGALDHMGLPRHIRAELWYRYHHTVRGGDAFALDAALRFAGQALRKGQPLGFMAQEHLPSPAERAGLLA